MSKAHRERYQKARETAMNKLMGQLGKPYLWGGTSPHTGFDCSGLVWYAYKDVVKFKIPRTANEMYHLRDAAPVNRQSLEKAIWSFSALITAAPPITLAFILATVVLFSRRAPVKIFKSASSAMITGSAIMSARVA